MSYSEAAMEAALILRYFGSSSVRTGMMGGITAKVSEMTAVRPAPSAGGPGGAASSHFVSKAPVAPAGAQAPPTVSPKGPVRFLSMFGRKSANIKPLTAEAFSDGN